MRGRCMKVSTTLVRCPPTFSPVVSGATRLGLSCAHTQGSKYKGSSSMPNLPPKKSHPKALEPDPPSPSLEGTTVSYAGYSTTRPEEVQTSQPCASRRRSFPRCRRRWRAVLRDHRPHADAIVKIISDDQRSTYRRRSPRKRVRRACCCRRRTPAIPRARRQPIAPRGATAAPPRRRRSCQARRRGSDAEWSVVRVAVTGDQTPPRCRRCRRIPAGRISTF
jgi:hypothetical protein